MPGLARLSLDLTYSPRTISPTPATNIRGYSVLRISYMI